MTLPTEKVYTELKQHFLEANQAFLLQDEKLITSGSSERGLCAALMCHLKTAIKETRFKKYHVDVEYNRNNGEVKTIRNNKEEIVPVTCDLIIHSRGESVPHDNLLALEMKRSIHRANEKESDKVRLSCLTKKLKDGVWGWQGTLPEHVCGYVIGIYYEINTSNRTIEIEYYKEGKKVSSEILMF